VSAVQVVTKPLEGIAEFLLQPIPVLNDISTFFGAGTFNMATLIGLDAQAVVDPGSLVPNPSNPSTFEFKPTAIDTLNYLANAIEIINHLQIGTATGTIALGSFSIKLNDPAPTTAPQDAFDIVTKINWAPNSKASTDARNNPDPKIGGIFTPLHKIQFNFPILDDPGNVFRMLMGDTSIALFDFKVKLGLTVTLKAPPIPIPLPPPITGAVNFLFTWGLGLPNVNFEIGFDEAGAKTGHVLDGFFIKNLTIGVSTTLTFAVDAGIPTILDVKLAFTVVITFGVEVVDNSNIDPTTGQPSTTLRGSSLKHLGITPTSTLSGSPFVELDLFDHCLLKYTFGTATLSATGVKFDKAKGGC
jgi:hypothetical protein